MHSVSRWNSASLINPIGHLDQIAVGVAEIEGEDAAGRAGTFGRCQQYGNTAIFQMALDVSDRCFGQEAKIARARRRPVCPGVDFAADRVQIYFLRTEKNIFC